MLSVETSFFSESIPDDQYFMLADDRIVVNNRTYDKLMSMESGSEEMDQYFKSMNRYIAPEA